MPLKRFIACALVLLACGCARFQFYGAENLSGQETGIKFYTAKPYLLVARTGNKEKPVEVSVTYLPDLSKPLYASPKSGLGSSNLTLSLSNGMLTQMGQQADTKIPELLTSVGGLSEALASAKKTRREADFVQQAGVDYSTASGQLGQIADGIDQQLKVAIGNNLLTPAERQVLQGIVNDLRAAAKALQDPTQAPQAAPQVADTLKKILDSWEKQIGGPGSVTTGPLPQLHRNLDQLKKQTQAALASISPAVAEQPTFTLYEIDNSGATTVLKEVKFP